MNLKSIAAAAVFSIAATTSVAQDVAPIPVVLSPTGPLTLSASFERSVSGLFVDTFTFTPATFAGDVSVNLTSVSGPVNFFAALLNGEGFSFFPESGQSSFAFSSGVSSDMPLQLTVLGFAGDAMTLTQASGSYRGNVVAVIPEPETYALMLAGLALVGAAARRRSRGHVGSDAQATSGA